MNPLAKIAYFFVDMVLPVCAGYLLVRKMGPNERLYDRLTLVGVLIVAPVLGFLSCWAIKLEAQLIWLPILGIGMQVIPGVAGFMRARSKSVDALSRGSYVLSAILSNRGFTGAVTVFILFGEVAYGYSRLVMLLAPPVLYGICYPMARYFHSTHYAVEGQKGSLTSLIFNINQAPMLGVIAGFALNFGGVERPQALGDVFQALVHVMAWTVLVPVGAAMDFAEMRDCWRAVLDLIPIKFVITPLLTYVLGRAVGLEGEVLATVVILAASPSAVNAVVVSKLQNLNVHLAMAAFVLTNIVYLFVVFPLMLMVVAWLGLT